MATIHAQNWDGVTAPALPAGWVADASIVTETSIFETAPNGLQYPVNTNIRLAYYNAADDGNGGDAQASHIVVPSSVSASCKAYIFCRMTAPQTSTASLTGYYASMDVATNAIVLGKYVTGANSVLASATAPTLFTGDQYKVYCSAAGTAIVARIQRTSDNKWLDNTNAWQAAQQDYLSATDSSISGAGKAGIGFSRSGGFDLLASDDFLFETVGTLTITFAETAPGVDYSPLPGVTTMAIDEGAPGGDGARIVYAELVFAERAPGYDAFVPFVPTIVFAEIAPGSDGSVAAPSLCTTRQRTKYCPNGDGTYRWPYPTKFVSSNNRKDIDPSLFITITAPATTGNPHSIPPFGGIDVESLAEAAFSWWRPTLDGFTLRHANSSGVHGEILPDDTLNNILYGLDEVAFGLKVTRTGLQHTSAGHIVPDGRGGHVMHIDAETSQPLSESTEFDWSAHVGDPQQVLLDSEGLAIGDGSECWEVNPWYDNTNFNLIRCESRTSTFHDFGSGFYQMTAVVWDTIRIEWLFGYYIYDIATYSCCPGGCPPCTDAVIIPAGATMDVCLSSSFVDCSTLPVGSAITGPAPWAGECILNSVIGCKANVTVPCLTQAEIDAGHYGGPYTITVPTTGKCLAGGAFRCEVLTGSFTISTGRVCEGGTTGVNPFSLQDDLGRYHATRGQSDGSSVSYQRSNFGTNQSVGWATESGVSPGAGKKLFDPRVVVDDRLTVILSYAQQNTADSSWDGVYIRRSNDDGKTWGSAALAIAGGKHPTIAIGQNEAFSMVIVAAYVGPAGGPGVITAKVQNAGDIDFGDAFNLKDQAGADLVAADDTFHIQQAPDDQNRWMLHVVIQGAGSSSQWTSFDDCKTWKAVT